MGRARSTSATAGAGAEQGARDRRSSACMTHIRTAKSHRPSQRNRTDSCKPRRDLRSRQPLRRGDRGASLPRRPGHLGHAWPIIR